MYFSAGGVRRRAAQRVAPAAVAATTSAVGLTNEQASCWAESRRRPLRSGRVRIGAAGSWAGLRLAQMSTHRDGRFSGDPLASRTEPPTITASTRRSQPSAKDVVAVVTAADASRVFRATDHQELLLNVQHVRRRGLFQLARARRTPRWCGGSCHRWRCATLPHRGEWRRSGAFQWTGSGPTSTPCGGAARCALVQGTPSPADSAGARHGCEAGRL
ncbi:uncharacterized protein V1510DRAFT_407627 [Dipodascopsis tothii]|uniref:uncharacterized protein n=1 Tax=Dipodascopsis tothii TaxID=44089 RepID=UPI0034CFDD00